MNVSKATIEYLLKESGFKYQAEFKFAPDRKFRFDFYLPDFKIGIEYEGIVSAKSRHTSMTGYSKDCEKYNLATMLGYRVLRYTALNISDLGRDLFDIKEKARIERAVLNHNFTKGA